MKTWKKLVSGLLTTLVLLTTLMVPVSADPSIVVTSGAIDNAAKVLPIYLSVQNDGNGAGAAFTTQTFATVTITDTSGLLTGTIGQVIVINSYDVDDISDGQATAFEIRQAIQGQLVAGDTYTIVVDPQPGLNPGMFGGATINPTTLTIVPTEANPAEAQNGLIDDINFDDNDYAPGATVEVEVKLEDANANYNDVVVEAWVEDPDGDRIGDKQETREFNMFADDDDETLDFEFDLPSDADEGVYTLYLVVESDEGVLDMSSSETFDVERADNSLYFDSLDIGSAAIAGETIDFAVSIFNNGLEDENDVRTSVTISGVGVSQTSSYFTVEEDDDAVRYFTLQLPSTMSAGTYQVTFRAWNGEIDLVETKEITVANVAGTISGLSGVTTSVDATSKMVHTVTGGAYILGITNNENRDVSYTISVAGTEGWANNLVNPTTVTLAPKTTGQVSVFVSPNEGASGLHQFSVYVKDGATIVDSLALTANVVAEPSKNLDILNTTTSVLAIVLVILAVLWVWRRDGAPRAPQKRRGTKKKEVYY